MAERSITNQNFGAWVLKCNPQTWDLAQWLADGNTLIDDWSVQDNYRSERMQPGDPTVLWVTGSDTANLEPGVWGTGHVVAAPWRVLGSAGAYWLDLDAADRVALIVGLDIVVTGVVVSRSVVRADPRLSSCELFRSPQMGNPNWLNKEEWTALQDYLEDDAPEPFDSVTRKALRADDEDALERDPLVRALVEKAAVEAIRFVLEEDGYSVDDVQKDNVGWDLEARRGTERRLVEVKGTAGRRPVVQLTSNEYRAATSEADWWLALVTTALEKPQYSMHEAAETVAAATPVGYRVDLDR